MDPFNEDQIEGKPLPLHMKRRVCFGDPRVLPNDCVIAGYTTKATCKCCATCQIRVGAIPSNTNGLIVKICYSGEQNLRILCAYDLMCRATGKCAECDKAMRIIGRSLGDEPS